MFASGTASRVTVWLAAWFALSGFFVATELLAGPPVAETDPLPPQEQRAKFKLPPGFEIQLVAAEPYIQKPMNLAFDSQGRLWVTHSIEYPFAAADAEQSRDGVTVLSNIGPDGRARQATKFADKVNIPIGVLPLPSGNEAIVWSIPNIWKLTDTDRDGVADKREVLYGPFDFVDTHGNQNAFRLGADGWIYACHGFRNASKIKLRGEGPDVLEMQSGNTYRFKPDGSAIEQISWGQVNPFGMCIDARGDIFTADCHSKPVTMILPGGYYDSFGKPDDGLGYAPITTSNDHGSTGIAGIVSYSANHFPAEFAGSMFVGNVVTNIVHRDTLEWRGSSPWVTKVEDFLTCDDWWFHPVDVQLGPDGALYISDFYNSIIGHYEVDLKHPRRDRHRGRIWRIVYTGTGATKQPAPVPPNLRQLSHAQLVTTLSAANLTLRNLAGRELEHRFGAASLTSATALIQQETTPEAKIQALWLLHRAGRLTPELQQQLAVDSSAEVRIHLLRVLGELPNWETAHATLVRSRLTDADPVVRRVAVTAIARHPDPANLKPLVELWNTTPADDAQLIHAVRIAIRNQLRPSAAVEQIASVQLNGAELARIVDIALAVPSESAAWFTFDFIRQHPVEQALVERCMRHVARYVGPQRLDEVAAFVQQKFPNDVPRQAALFQSLLSGLTQRGSKLVPDSELGHWAGRLSAAILDPAFHAATPWENQIVPGLVTGNTASPWGVSHRNSTDGNTSALYFDSIVEGETLTGKLTSAPFVIPDQLSFWMCGHNGLPGTDPQPVNHVRLRLVDSGEIVARQIPPRNDVAQKYTWDLKPWAGQQGVFEAVDADTGSAYAWLAVGRFEPGVLAEPVENLAFVDTSLTTAIQISSQLQRRDLAPRIIELLLSPQHDVPVRIAAAQSGLSLNRDLTIAALMTVAQNPLDPGLLRVVAAQQLGPIDTPATRQALGVALSNAPGPLQQPLALALSATPTGGEFLFQLIAQGKASARLLQDQPLLDRLSKLPIENRDDRIAELTRGLPAADDRLRQVLAKFSAGIAPNGAADAPGAAVFKKTCAACHRLQNEGGKIGPQLDGVGNRGLERLLEDILDSNRNVDAAFRAIVVAKTDGVVVTGLKLREEGGAIIIGDSQGKEVRVPLDEIEESRISNLSPMPSNFAEQLNEHDLRALVSFLLGQKQMPAKAEPE